MQIRICDLSFAYREHQAISQLSVEFESGVTGLLGVNGAGKTTLLRLIAGELRPSSGSIVRFDGVSTKSGEATVGFCPQSPVMPGHLRVGEFLEYLAWLRRMDRTAVVAEALEWADLGGHRRKPLKTLSGGTLRRVAIAQALMGRPDIVLLDEPTTGLDPQQRIRIRALLRTLPSTATVILSSHILEDVAAVAPRAVVIGEGRVTLDVALSGDASVPLLEEAFLRAASGPGASA